MLRIWDDLRFSPNLVDDGRWEAPTELDSEPEPEPGPNLSRQAWAHAHTPCPWRSMRGFCDAWPRQAYNNFMKGELISDLTRIVAGFRKKRKNKKPKSADGVSYLSGSGGLWMCVCLWQIGGCISQLFSLGCWSELRQWGEGAEVLERGREWDKMLINSGSGRLNGYPLKQTGWGSKRVFWDGSLNGSGRSRAGRNPTHTTPLPSQMLTQ